MGGGEGVWIEDGWCGFVGSVIMYILFEVVRRESLRVGLVFVFRVCWVGGVR